MPYFKTIGQTPYYIKSQKKRLFETKQCNKVQMAMNKIGITCKREQMTYGCVLTYQDNYDAWVSSMTSNPKI